MQEATIVGTPFPCPALLGVSGIASPAAQLLLEGDIRLIFDYGPRK
jgi:hypothetical protein